MRHALSWPDGRCTLEQPSCVCPQGGSLAGGAQEAVLRADDPVSCALWRLPGDMPYTEPCMRMAATEVEGDRGGQERSGISWRLGRPGVAGVHPRKGIPSLRHLCQAAGAAD